MHEPEPTVGAAAEPGDADPQRGGLIWVRREIPVDAQRAWELFADVEQWSSWGPSVRDAGLDGPRFDTGATGWVRTPFGVRLPFVLTDVVEGSHWSWTVAGVPATTHAVTSTGPASCSVGFGIPAVAAPYALVCRRALSNIERVLTA